MFCFLKGQRCFKYKSTSIREKKNFDTDIYKWYISCSGLCVEQEVIVAYPAVPGIRIEILQENASLFWAYTILLLWCVWEEIWRYPTISCHHNLMSMWTGSCHNKTSAGVHEDSVTVSTATKLVSLSILQQNRFLADLGSCGFDTWSADVIECSSWLQFVISIHAHTQFMWLSVALNTTCSDLGLCSRLFKES